MKIYFSDFFDISPQSVEDYGAFDVSLINDLPLFVDPFLLFNSRKLKYKQLHAEIIKYMRFLRDECAGNDISEPLVRAWFTFPEVKQNWLGLTGAGNEGHGLGMDFARALRRNLSGTFKDFGEETVTRGSHLEKLCLIRDGVGRDNISDFTTNLIKSFIAEYTQAFAQRNISKSLRRTVPLSKSRFNYETRSWVTEHYDLPYINGDFVLLSPRDILTKDESWINRSDLLDSFSSIAQALPNSVLRAQVNDYLSRVLPRGPLAKKKEVRAAVANAVERFPEVLDYYIREKEKDGDRASAYASARVENVEQLFVEQIRELVSMHLAPYGFYAIGTTTKDEALKRIYFLKDVIENKGGHRLFYVKDHPIEREEDLHIMFRLTWFATPSDVTREANDGRGPADFKISRGAYDKTIVEFKLAKNTHLKKNLVKQAEIYSEASDATHAPLKVIMYFDDLQLARVQDILKELKLTRCKDIVLIDASLDEKMSGSKA